MRVLLLAKRNYEARDGAKLTALSLLDLDRGVFVERTVPRDLANDISDDMIFSADNPVVLEAITEDTGWSIRLLGFSLAGKLEWKIKD